MDMLNTWGNVEPRDARVGRGQVAVVSRPEHISQAASESETFRTVEAHSA
jgi:hypothetical protein